MRAEGLSATPSAAVVPKAPENLDARRRSPAPRGSAATLTCGDGTWNADYPITARRWLRAGVAIAGQTAATYRVVAADVGQPIACEATAAGLTAATSAPLEPAAPRVIHAPQIEGDRRIGTTLSCTPGEWDATYDLTYRWLRDGVPAGTATSLAVGKADVGAEFVCEVTAAGLTVAASDVTTVEPPALLAPPKITGAAQLRGTLECSRGLWDDTAAARYAVSYQWFKDDVAIADATAARLGPLGRADLDADYTCEVTAEGLTAERAEPVEVLPPSIVGEYPQTDGQPYVGRAITCDRGRWNDSEALPYSYTYRWERSVEGWERIPGADAQTYVVQSTDVDRQLRCVVTAEGDWTVEGYGTYGSWPAVESTLTARDDSVTPGAENGYRLTLRNPNPINVFLQYAYISLPDGFTYKPGSTTGSTTADPESPAAASCAGATGCRSRPASTLTLDVVVTASATAGHFFATGGGYATNYTPWIYADSGAIVSVAPPLDESTCTILGTAGDDVLKGTAGNDVHLRARGRRPARRRRRRRHAARR